MASANAAVLERAFAEHRSFLWSLCYRLCGDAADADDIVQDTFVRALQHPPARTDEPWRPWLVRVALNLGRDLLRRRRRRHYEGPWLPAPVEEPEAPPTAEPAARYDRVESVSMAFLVALEALTPTQRAVLLLRDVFDYSVRETAEALALGEPNVKTTHHRARKAMAGYDAARVRPTRALLEATRRALERFLAAMNAGDAAQVEALLADDVHSLADGGGEYAAARNVIRGRARVAQLYTSLAAKVRATHADLRVINGLPALVADFAGVPRGWPPRVVLQCEIDQSGRIRRLYSVSASRKLTGLR